MQSVLSLDSRLRHDSTSDDHLLLEEENSPIINHLECFGRLTLKRIYGKAS